MPYTTLGSATAGQVYTAAAHNAIIGNLNTLGPAAFNIQSAVKVDTFSSTTADFQDVTGLSVSITPSSATSKVLVIVSLSLSTTATDGRIVGGRILRGATPIGGGTAVGNRLSGSFFVWRGSSTNNQHSPVTHVFLDSPATTTATTYKVQVRPDAAGSNVSLNIGGDDNDIANRLRQASTITVIEVPV